MSAGNYICSDNQRPCSSTAPGSSYPFPPSNMSNPESPFNQSSGPPSRNMTPGYFHQRTDPMQTHMWLQSHHDTMAYNQRPYSAAPSVMSNMTRISGMSAISINTQATTMSYSNNQFLGMPSGPLSSSENIDPKQDLIVQMAEVISCLRDDDIAVRSKAAELIKACPKRLKEASPEVIIEIVPELLRKTAYALNAEKEFKTQLVLCDAVSELVRAFCPLAAKIVQKEKNDPGGFLAVILSFAKNLETDEDKRKLRHLLPAYFPLFMDESTHSICVEGAKSTDLFVYLCTLVTVNFQLAKNGRSASMIRSLMKQVMCYINLIRLQLRNNVEHKKYLIKRGIHLQMIEILQFLENCRESQAQGFETLIAHCYGIIITCFKALLGVNVIEIVDQVVESRFIQYFMHFRVAFEPILTASLVEYTYSCFTYLTDSKKLKEMSKQIPSPPNKPMTMVRVLYHDFAKAINDCNTKLCCTLLQFECNCYRIPGFVDEAISCGHHIHIITCFNSVAQQFRQQSKQENENVDNSLMILQKFSEHCNINLIDQFFDDLFHPEVIPSFIVIIQKMNPKYVLRVLQIWLKCIQTKPEKLLKFVEQQVSVATMVLYVIFTNISAQDPHNLPLELAIKIYKLLIQIPALKREIIQSLQNWNLFELINRQDKPEIILKLLPLTHQLWQSSIEIKHFIDVQMREMLGSLRNSTNPEIARQVQQMLSTIEIEADDFVPPLANAFSFDGFS
uniref:Uncharacterized protein n=1 Tax=Panagrolaimus sp. JU765 TaxID=591449 RepID=A0AC34RP72_9BILA